MANRYATLAATLLVAGATGTSLYTASTAQEARTAISAAQHVTTTHGDLAVHVDAGLSRLAVGTAGQVLAVSDAGVPHWAAAPAASGPTIRYASDFVAESGSESAIISGTGALATITLGASANARTYGTAGATAARAVLEIPAGAREVEVEIQVVAASGLSTGGWRYLGVALRNAIPAGAPSVLWGVSVNDNNAYWAANLMGGANSGHQSGSVVAAPVAADRWWRVLLQPRAPFLAHMTGIGSAGARPSTWSPPSAAIPLPINNSNAVFVPDLGATSSLVIYLQSFGNGGAGSLTARVTVRLLAQ